MEKVEMNKDMKLSELYGLRLSPHFTLGEMTKTNHKTADGNIPSRVVMSNHLTGCAVDIRVTGFEQAIRYASILLDISDGTKRDYDELFIERNKAGSHWIHFAVRPTGNRRKTDFLKV